MKSTCKNLFPEHIRTVAVTAPAGAPNAEKLAVSLKLLQSQVKVKLYLPEHSVDTVSHTVPDYLAADSNTRLSLLNQAINDPEVDLILCARGGFGCVHLLENVDYDCLRRRNLPVMGYSDITALHCAMLKYSAGVPIAGSNLIGLENIVNDPLSQQSHYAALALPDSEFKLPAAPQKLCSVLPETNPATVCAKAYAANLTMLASLCGTNFMPDFSNMILILEDVNEPVYKIDRMLSQLKLNNVFKNLAALVFGQFTCCGENSPQLDMLLRRIAVEIALPCFDGFQFGHTFPMCAVNSSKKLLLTANNDYLII